MELREYKEGMSLAYVLRSILRRIVPLSMGKEIEIGRDPRRVDIAIGGTVRLEGSIAVDELSVVPAKRQHYAAFKFMEITTSIDTLR